MRNSILASLVASGCVAALPLAGLAASAAKARSIADPSVQLAVAAAVQRDRMRYGGKTPIPATIVGIWDDMGHSFVKTFGYADLAKKKPLTTADHFRIGSNTKTFVVATLLQLVGEKKLSLDDPLSRFDVGVKVPNAQHITVRELCDMRSGLFEAYDTPQFDKLNWKVPPNYNPRMLVGWAVRNKPYFPPQQRLQIQQHQLPPSRAHHRIGDQRRRR